MRPAQINDGQRPNLLELGQRATGERSGPIPDDYARALDDAKAHLPPFDMKALRARSHRLDPHSAPDRAPAPPTPRGRARWWTLVPALAAAVALFLLLPPSQTERTKGLDGARLDYFVLVDGQIQPGDPDQVLGQGDRVQFTTVGAGLDSLVLLSVDGDGTLTVFWPEEGDEPVSIEPHGTHLLRGSVELDDAPGPEVFVGLFGFDSVEDARSVALDAWRQGGAEGLLDLADDNPDVDSILIERER